MEKEKIEELAKEYSEGLKMTNFQELGNVFLQAQYGFEKGFIEAQGLYQSQIETLKKEKEELQTSINSLRQEVNINDIRIDDSNKEISDLKSQIETLKMENEELVLFAESNAKKSFMTEIVQLRATNTELLEGIKELLEWDCVDGTTKDYINSLLSKHPSESVSDKLNSFGNFLINKGMVYHNSNGVSKAVNEFLGLSESVNKEAVEFDFCKCANSYDMILSGAGYYVCSRCYKPRK